MNLHVLVGPVKYSWQIIKSIADLKKIEPYIIKRVNDIENVLASLSESYVYNDAKSAQTQTRVALDDALEGKLEVRGFMSYLRRLFIVSGLSVDDGSFSDEIQTMYDLANYLERNKDEM